MKKNWMQRSLVRLDKLLKKRRVKRLSPRWNQRLKIRLSTLKIIWMSNIVLIKVDYQKINLINLNWFLNKRKKRKDVL